jgi:hypothetical protein
MKQILSLHPFRFKAGVLPAAFAALLFVSCSANISGRLEQDASGSLSLKAALEPKTAALIRSFSKISGKSQTGPLLDSQAINRSLQTAPGISTVSLKNTAPEAIEGTIAVGKIGDFLAAKKGNRFVTFEPSGASGGRLAVHLDRESGQEIISLISRDTSDYLSALMAPLATGEKLSKAEYLTLVASIYDKAVADEIARSKLNAVLSVPGRIRNVKGGAFTGREARFELPLLDILVLERPLDYEIVW